MNPQQFLDELSQKLSGIAARGPAADVEKNARATMQSLFGRLDLVTREEFDVQTEVLLRTRQELEALQARVAELEARVAQLPPMEHTPPQ